MMTTPQNIPGSDKSKFNLKVEIERYLEHWRWFVIGLLVTFFGAFLYLRYSIPQYKANSTVLVKDAIKGNMTTELEAFRELGLIGNVKGNVDNEIEVLKSRTLIESTIRALQLNVAYYGLGRVKSEEIYNESPIQVLFFNTTKVYNKYKHYYVVQYKNEKEFALYDQLEKKIGEYNYGATLAIDEVQMMITKVNPDANDYSIGIEVTPVEQLVDYFKSKLAVSVVGKNTSVIELNLVDPVRAKAEDFLNTLVQNYNNDAIQDKKFVAENTSKFIEQRLKIIADELKDVEKDVETFKRKNHVTDIVSEAGLFLENASAFEKKEIEVETQIKVVEALLERVTTDTNKDLIPANIIPMEEGAASLIAGYNQLILDRNRLLKTATPKNAVILTIDNKIEALRENVIASLEQLKISLEIQRKDLASQRAKMAGKISQIPTQEKLFRDIDRKQHIKETLYLYLLEKREEAEISLAVTEPNAKVIDTALAAKNPIFPNRKMVYLVALALGLAIPFIILYIIALFDTKIKTAADVTDNISIPFLGEVPKFEEDHFVFESTNRSATAEALRIVRTNLEFLLSDVSSTMAKTIFVTSTYPKEGKTFVSVNLASIIAQSDKRVLLVGLDIRNPKLGDYFDIPSDGLTNYLVDKKGTSIQNYIVTSKMNENLAILPSGVVPPNPAELLMSNKIEEMFEQLKVQFDYIVVDTAPISLVSDTLIIAKYADAFVYVVRAHVLDKQMLNLPQRLYNERKLNNMSILLNDSVIKRNYGYTYGYEVIEKPRSSWERLWGILFKKS